MLRENYNLKVAAIQIKVNENPQHNINRAIVKILEAADNGAQLICLPELFTIPYPAQRENENLKDTLSEIYDIKLNERIMTIEKIKQGGTWKNNNSINKNLEALIRIAKEKNVGIISGSFYEKTKDNHYYNTSFFISNTGKILSKYRKIHIPYDPYYYEKFYFESGNLGYPVIEFLNWKIGTLICYDQWFPEPSRIMALAGAQLIVYPTAIGWFDELKKEEPFSLKRWKQAVAAQASLNGIYTIAINRVGIEDKIDFWGSSIIVDPFGNIIVEASNKEEQIIYAEINTENVFLSQDGWGFIRNRKPETYKAILRGSGKK